MSRGRLIVIGVVVAIVAILVLLSSMATEVPQTRVEKPVAADAAAK